MQKACRSPAEFSAEANEHIAKPFLRHHNGKVREQTPGTRKKMIKILDSVKISEIYNLLDEKTIRHLKDSQHYVSSIGDRRYVMTFRSKAQAAVSLYADSEVFMLVTDDENIRSCAAGIDSETGFSEAADFFLSLTSVDVLALEEIENKISGLEDELLTSNRADSKFNISIVKLRKEVLSLKRYHIQMEFLSDELAELDSHFSFVEKKFNRLLEFTLHLQEYVEQVREAYQSQIDIEQSSIMKFFTVVTTIFLPLTLITGWYGMNLLIPEFHWKYGYLYVICLSFVVVLIMIGIFKKKKWF